MGKIKLTEDLARKLFHFFVKNPGTRKKDKLYAAIKGDPVLSKQASDLEKAAKLVNDKLASLNKKTKERFQGTEYEEFFNL